jgi:hypothetical protein
MLHMTSAWTATGTVIDDLLDAVAAGSGTRDPVWCGGSGKAQLLAQISPADS